MSLGELERTDDVLWRLVWELARECVIIGSAGWSYSSWMVCRCFFWRVDPTGDDDGTSVVRMGIRDELPLAADSTRDRGSPRALPSARKKSLSRAPLPLALLLSDEIHDVRSPAANGSIPMSRRALAADGADVEMAAAIVAAAGPGSDER